ncbi:MAG: 5-formyltetrahydrofolate cyclo-ligase [Oscillospiraceae bacterium]
MAKVDAGEERIRIWEELRKVARPDSRFSFDFSEFITDYEGSEEGAELFVKQDFYKNSNVIFVTPDNNLEHLREIIIRDRKTMIMTNYGISRGFFIIRPGDVPEGREELASTLDGVQRFWHHRTLAALKEEVGHVDLLVTGASAMTLSGIRFGKGHGYFDLEWAMQYTAGLADETSVIVGVGHDCQVTDIDVEVTEHDTAIDWIVTPTRVIKTRGEFPRPTCGIIWSRLDKDMLGRIPPLQELWWKIACK